jgi:hypothetical protein
MSTFISPALAAAGAANETLMFSLSLDGATL